MFRSLDLGNDEVFQILEKRDLKGIAKYMQSDNCKHIIVMVGAGISTAAGIPDFRSPGTGLYANLARLNLPYPEAVFDIRFFQNNPLPFYVLAHELAPGKFRPTLTHSFIRLLAEKGKLNMCFSQNIDTLERRAGVPAEKIIEAHGSFATQHCIKCKASFPDDEMKDAIKSQKIPHCKRSFCKGLVKPDIVFFGESLPDSFHAGLRRLKDADLLICMGTSLTVHPFASLIGFVPQDCPRLLINLDHVGDWGSRVNDVAVLKKCDVAVHDLCKELGWEKELMKLWEATANTVEVTPSANAPKKALTEEVKDEEEKLQNEIAKIVDEIDSHLKISSEHERVSRIAVQAQQEKHEEPTRQDVNATQQSSSMSATGKENQRTETEANPSPTLQDEGNDDVNPGTNCIQTADQTLTTDAVDKA